MIFVTVYLVIAAVVFGLIAANLKSFNIGNKWAFATCAALLWPMFIANFLHALLTRNH